MEWKCLYCLTIWTILSNILKVAGNQQEVMYLSGFHMLDRHKVVHTCGVKEKVAWICILPSLVCKAASVLAYISTNCTSTGGNYSPFFFENNTSWDWNQNICKHVLFNMLTSIFNYFWLDLGFCFWTSRTWKCFNLNIWFPNCGTVTTGDIWGVFSGVQSHHWHYYMQDKCHVICAIEYDSKWGTSAGGSLWCVSFISEVYILELRMIRHDT